MAGPPFMRYLFPPFGPSPSSRSLDSPICFASVDHALILDGFLLFSWVLCGWFFLFCFVFFSFFFGPVLSEFARRRWRDFRRNQGPKGRATTIVMASVGKCRTLFAWGTIRFVLSNLFSKVYTLVFTHMDHLRLPRVIPKKTKIAVFRFISLW